MSTATLIVPEFRKVQPADLPHIMAIENKNSAKSHPVVGVWTQEDFRITLAAVDHEGIVALVKGSDKKYRLVGFVVYCLMQGKIHICNMAVHPTYERRGIGTKILNEMKKKLDKKRVLLEIDIRESNLAGQLFLKKQQFLAISVVRDWYEQPPEDAYKFQFKKGEN